MNKKLQRTIEKQLANLDRKLEKVRNYNVEPDNQNTWDVDYYL